MKIERTMPGPHRPPRSLRRFAHDNGLLLTNLGLFAAFFIGMVVSGAATYNQQQQEHGSAEHVSIWESHR